MKPCLIFQFDNFLSGQHVQFDIPEFLKTEYNHDSVLLHIHFKFPKHLSNASGIEALIIPDC